jgi:hypothetical protein
MILFENLKAKKIDPNWLMQIHRFLRFEMIKQCYFNHLIICTEFAKFDEKKQTELTKY